MCVHITSACNRLSELKNMQGQLEAWACACANVVCCLGFESVRELLFVGSGAPHSFEVVLAVASEHSSFAYWPLHFSS